MPLRWTFTAGLGRDDAEVLVLGAKPPEKDEIKSQMKFLQKEFIFEYNKLDNYL